ncbi:MAG: hypothetical protein JNL49_10915 [Bacteroidia bacterium]|nr:hypothetical protein [Bacteroidia bacterium]
MTKQKSNLNWYFLVVGIFILYISLTNNQTNRETELKKITVELYKDITLVKGRKSSVEYKFWTKEYNNQFNILNGSISKGKHEAISNLKGGQLVDLYISPSEFENLSHETENITVEGISLNGIFLMTQAEFYRNRELYKFRLEIFSVFTALMLLLNGLIKIPKKINYIIIGVFIGSIIIMRIFEIGIY